MNRVMRETIEEMGQESEAEQAGYSPLVGTIMVVALALGIMGGLYVKWCVL